MDNIARQLKLDHPQSLFLFGPRMTGKSTLLKQLYPLSESVMYVDLLATGTFWHYTNDPNTLYREVKAVSSKIKTVILDEVQRVPALLSEVHRLIEEFPGIKFILSGSSARKLKKLQADLLAGRALTCRLFPLTCQELAEKFDLTKALEVGTLPKIYLEPKKEIATQILRSYVETYLTEEIKQEALVRNLHAFLRFLPLAGAESGNILNYSNLSREVGVSYKTIQEYFQILEDTLIINFLPAFARAARKTILQHPKFYFFDTGVLRAIRQELTLDLQPKTEDYGYYFEHFVINELRKHNAYFNKDCRFYFYRTTAGEEVDLIIELPGKKIAAVEIKAKTTLGKNDFKGLNSFKEFFPQAKLYLIALVDRPQQYDDILVLPWSELLQTIISP